MRRTTKIIAPSKPKLQFDPAKKQVLHVANSTKPFAPLPKQFAEGMWQEIRMGSYSGAKPHITASLLKMSGVASKQFHAAWIPSGNLEQLSFHQVPVALQEMHRVLRDSGTVVISVFDVQRVAEFVAKGNLEGPLYQMPDKTIITAIDVLYGHRPQVQAGDMSVIPNTAFTVRSLAAKLKEAGFNKIQVKREGILLWAVAHKLVQDKNIPPHIEIIEEDVNQMMRTRDELDKAPEIWTAPSPLFPVVV